MTALATLFPVFFMLGLGFLACRKGWVSPDQKSGANAIIFKILFPILVFQLIASATFRLSHLAIFLYVFTIFSGALLIGKLLAPKISKESAHFSPYLLTVVEGGNVALPLYLSIVGTSSNTVLFDLPAIVIAFLVFPFLIAKEAATDATVKGLIRSIFTNSFVIAVLAGLVLNLTGLYQLLAASPLGPVISATFAQATAPIVSMILFILGYDLKIDRKTLGPILKLMAVKTIYYALVIAGFFIFFPDLMADKIFMMAPIIYFMSPSGFALTPIIAPLYKSEKDAAFTSAFTSIFILVTLLVYTGVVLFIA